MITKKIKVVTKKDEKELDNVDEAGLSGLPDSFFEEVTVFDVLDCSEDKEILNKLCGKVRKGGVLSIYGVDFIDLCRNVYNESVSLESVAEIVKELKSPNSIVYLKDHFEKNGWKVLFAGVKNSNYVIKVQK